MKIELYIDKQLCDIGQPDRFSVTLRRQFYNPAELSTKDAQASYNISLPTSTTNNYIFGLINVEEVKGKFERLYDAQLIVDGMRIFDGKFRMNEITATAYKGNLGIPAIKSLKELFGDKPMNKAGMWQFNIPKLSIISDTNALPQPPCIFPLVLYGLLPKTVNTDGKYSDKDSLDHTVRFALEDFPPSVNCIEMLKTIFKQAGYQLLGSALNDEQLKALYVSYKNPPDYVQEWNWGDLATMHVSGKWSTAPVLNGAMTYGNYERQISLNSNEKGSYFSVNMFNSNRAELTYSDTGTNIIYSEYADKYVDKKDYTRKSLHLIIPKSGYYKVRLECDKLQLHEGESSINSSDDTTGFKFTGIKQHDHYNRNNTLDRKRYELQLLRDYGEGDFHDTNIVGFFNTPQFPQTSFYDPSQHPKYYPFARGPMVIDPCVNPNFICGLSWGKNQGSDDFNPHDTVNRCNYMFIANGFSWDKTFAQKHKIRSVYDSVVYDERGLKNGSNYHCWGTEDDGTELTAGQEEEGDKPDWLKGNVNVRYGTLANYPKFDKTKDPYVNLNNAVEVVDYKMGKGMVESIIWLERGERLAVSLVGDMADMRRGSNHKTEFGSWICLVDELAFSLSVEPFRTDMEWNNYDNSGNANRSNEGSILDWNAPITFQKGSINLIDFLPANLKIDDWVDNFCKAFNLELINKNNHTIELNLKQRPHADIAPYIIDLDNRTHLVHRANEAVDLPYKYQIGFTTDADEEGYYRLAHADGGTTTNKDVDMQHTGGGEFYTGSIDTHVVEQKSNFSYCWYKHLYDQRHTTELDVPIISDHEVWDRGADDYAEMLPKQYTDKAQRFWYKNGTHTVRLGKSLDIDVALVRNQSSHQSALVLDYKDTPHSLSRNYFYLLAGDAHYTHVECYLTPHEYQNLDIATAKYNGDLYRIASVDAYDPAQRRPTKLKLLRQQK
ncbi:MAG: hypothetical protein RL662_1738 [Bacteroidota bacterium]|jgi:hypothetical protein